MASASAGDFGRHLSRLFGAGSAVGLTDGDLLERFAHRRDEAAEAAFETLLARHGAMVLTVCRQVLGDSHSAEDAFQATFLVVVRRARSLRVREPGSLGPWLHGVAYRIALKTRQAAARRRAHEHRVAVPVVGTHCTAIENDELQSSLHDEVNRLPAKYRAPVVLCYFEGRTHDEAAASLGWPVGTVRGRLARARDRLRSRLTRRGLAPSDWIGSYLLAPAARIEPSARLLEATVAAAIRGTPTATVGVMANVMLRNLLLARLPMAGAVVSIALIAAGFGLAVSSTRVLQPGPQPDPAPAPIAPARVLRTAIDRQGDPLPRFARARIGTNRFHAGSHVLSVTYTRDAKSLVTLERPDVVRVWDAITGQVVREIGDANRDRPMTSPGLQIALSPDGQTLATAEPSGQTAATVDQPGRLRLWDVNSGRERRRWLRIPATYEGLTFSPDGRTVAAGERRFDETTKRWDSFIDLWDTTALTERRRRIPGDWVWLWDLAFSPDGKVLATASRDSEIMDGNTLIGADKGSTRLWDTATGRELRRFPVDRLDFGSLAFSPDSKLLAVTVSDGTVRFYDVTSRQERLPRLGPEPARLLGRDIKDGPSETRQIIRLAFSPDGTILAGGDGHLSDFSLANIHLWDVARGQERLRIPAHQQHVSSLSFAPDGKTLASTGGEPVVRLWDVASGRELVPQSGHRSGARSLVVSPADGTVFTAGDDGTIRQWDPSSGRELGLIAQLNGPVESLSVSSDGETLLIGGSTVTQPRRVSWMHIWSVAERREIRRLAQQHEVTYIAYSPDGKTFASNGRIWDTVSGKVLVTLRHHDPQNDRFMSFSPIFYTPDSKQILTAEPGGAWIWDIATGREARRAVLWSNCHDRATLSPDGRFLATRGPRDQFRGRSEDWPYRIWELASGQEVATIDAHGDHYLLGPFSPNGRFLATAGGRLGQIVRVLDLVTGREVRRFEGHRGAVNAVAFARDGRSVISASDDATALVWDISDLMDLPTSDDPITADELKARWAELAGADARAAYGATWALSIRSAVPFLREHLRPATSADPKGIPAASGPIAPPEVLRTLRAIAALERVGTPEARAVLETLARGNPGAIETRDAKLAIDRLTRRPAARASSSHR